MSPLYPFFSAAPSSRSYLSEGCCEQLEEHPGCREEGDPVGNGVVEEVEFTIEDFLQQSGPRNPSCCGRRRRRRRRSRHRGGGEFLQRGRRRSGQSRERFVVIALLLIMGG